MNGSEHKGFQFCGPLLESLADGVFAIDSQWRIRVFNRAAEKITGIPRDEAIGQICCEVFRASICETSCALRQAIETQEPVIDRTVFIIDSNGRQIPISISAAVLKDEAGTVIGGVETFRDLSQVETLKRELSQQFTFKDIISRSPRMKVIFDMLPAVAQSRSSVLITGESGTGKELTARAIHNAGPRASDPFVAVNCGAIPDSLLESELFGYKKGAFTDARTDKPGRFTLAGKGTLFLDEIGDISPSLQVKLLRVLEEGVYEPLGSVQSQKTTARILTATNRDLEEMVHAGTFREDLFYRINVVNIELPPLRERTEDIPYLVSHFIHHFNQLQGKHILRVADDVLAVLMNYDYHGNIRELRNIIERAFVVCLGDVIRLNHLPGRLAGEHKVSLPDTGMTLDEMEKVFIDNALERTGGNIQQAADELGIHRATLYRKIKKFSGEESV